jgi:diguanylate cyclase (GGDEF)-like protein
MDLLDTLAPRTTLGRRLSLAVGLPLLLALGIGLGLTWREAKRAAAQSALEEASALADLVAGAFAVAPQSDPSQPHPAVDEAIKTEWKGSAAVHDARVFDRTGLIRWSRRTEELGQKHDDFDPAMMNSPRGFQTGNVFVLPIGGVRCAACHMGDSLHLGAVELTLAPPREITDVDNLYSQAMGGAILLVLFFVVVGAAVVRRLVTRRLMRLAQAMERAKQGDFLVRVPVEGTDEISGLAAGFNSMLARITDLKVAEIEANQDLARMQRELQLKAELEQRQKELQTTNGKLEESVRELQLLFELTRSVNSTLELGPLLEQISGLVGRTLGYAEFSVMLLDNSKSELQHQAGYGLATHETGEVRFQVGEGAAGMAAQSGEVVHVEDVATDGRFIRREAETGSLLCVPMVYKGDKVGVLNFRKTGPAGFGPEEQRLLGAVANQAATAIVNARLYQATVELSLTDALTGTFNRRHLFQQLELEVMRAQRFGTPLSTIMIDIDHFKHLNDTGGHASGDTVLREVAELLRGQLRKVDTLARYGGEEFFVMLPQTSKDQAVEVAEKLRRSVAEKKFAHGEQQPAGRVTISCGVSCMTDDAEKLDRLVDAADAALYASKRGGRDKVTPYATGMELHPGRERGPQKPPPPSA